MVAKQIVILEAICARIVAHVNYDESAITMDVNQVLVVDVITITKPLVENAVGMDFIDFNSGYAN